MFLNFFYWFCQTLVRLTFPIMYARIEVRNQTRMKLSGPCIVVSNHPSTLMDPFHVAGVGVRGECHFLANASLFKSAFGNWFFTTFYCIKIERPQDTDGRQINNEAAFQKAINHIKSKGNLFVAVEGSSSMERKLREVKTGAARIALFAEAQSDFQLGTTILPVGLDYDAPHKFRSNVAINAAELIRVSDFRAIYEANPIEGVNALTEAMEQGLKSVIIHVEDATQEPILRQLETMLQNENQVSPNENVDRLKALLIKLNEFKDNQNTDYQLFMNKIINYFDNINEFGISDNIVAGKAISIFRTFYLVFMFPIFVIGLLNHVVILGIIILLHKQLKDLYIGYYMSMYFMSGLLFLPIIYPLQNWFLRSVFGIHINGWLYIIVCLAAGVAAWYWFAFAKDFIQRCSISKAKLDDLKSERKEILLGINSLAKQ